MVQIDGGKLVPVVSRTLAHICWLSGLATAAVAADSYTIPFKVSAKQRVT